MSATPSTTDARDWTALYARRWRTASSDAIREILAVASATDVIAFSGGFPDPATFPVDRLPALLAEVLESGDAAALQYAPTPGLASVRDFLAGRVERLEGRRPGDGELMVTSGSMEAMELIGLALLDPGDPVIVEGPSFVGAIMAFRSLEADLSAVPLDGAGLRTDELERRLHDGARPKFVYTIPDFQNPAGVSLALDRRRHLVDLADRYGFVVVEDVAYRELWLEHPPPPSLWSLHPDVVVQLGTFSKLFFPGVRLGWAVGPDPLIERMVAAKQSTDQCSGALGQRLLEVYGRGGGLDTQVERSRGFYRERRDRLLSALESDLADVARWTRPGGGFFTWLTVDGEVDTSALAAAARERHVAYVPGSAFHTDGQGRRSMRLSFSRIADADIPVGVGRLAEVVREVLGTATAGGRR